MPARQKRLVIPLDDSASEGLAMLAELTGVGEATLAKRLLSAVLMVIGNAPTAEESYEEWRTRLDRDQAERNRILAEPKDQDESAADIGMRRFGRLPPGFNGRFG